jgi:hypothetical protein
VELEEAQKAVREVAEFVEQFRTELGCSERRRNCSQYLSGLILPGERKSIEPMAQRVVGGDVQSLQQFVSQSPWNYLKVQKKPDNCHSYFLGDDPDLKDKILADFNAWEGFGSVEQEVEAQQHRTESREDYAEVDF